MPANRRRVIYLGLLAVTTLFCWESVAAPIDPPWPTVHRDYQRSGYTPEVIAGPYERKWFRDFHDEMIATRVEAILAEGKCFVGTFAGNFYALDVADGRTLWQHKAAGAIGASACYNEGRVFYGSDDGRLYCLHASDGKEIWHYPAGAGIWVAPACDGKTVYFGDRAGVFHAISAADGQRQWTLQTGGMILTPASFSPDFSKIIFGSEDMRVYCVNPAGELLWKSAKLGGLSMRDHAPVIWRGLAIVTTNPAIRFHRAAGENPAILTKAQKDLPMESDDKVVFDKWGSYVMRLTPRRLRAEHETIRRFLSANRHEQTFYALDLESGREPWVAPVLYTAGLHNPPTAPTFNPHTGELYVWAPSALSNYSAGVPGGAIAIAKLDRQSGLTEILYHTNGERLGWAFDFAAPADETQALSLMGGILLNTHQGIIGGMNLETLKWHRIYIARDTYGGIYGPAVTAGSFAGADKAHAQGTLALMPNEWHGPDRSIAAIGNGRLFWVVGSQVVCLGGPDTARSASGGKTAPPPIQRKVMPVVPAGNVAAGIVGRFDASIPRPRITPQQLRKYIDPPALGPLPEPARAISARLDEAVDELIATDAWAPFVVELGISGEDRYFWRTAETMQILGLALPHVSGDVRGRARAYLDRMFRAGCPLTSPTHAPTGSRRELYDLGPEMIQASAPPSRYTTNVEDLYAVWAYAHYADRWNEVLSKLDALGRIYDAFAARPASFDHSEKAIDACEHLNAQIAGTLAYARIMARAGKAAEADRAMMRLAELVEFRVHHELADTAFVRSSKTATGGLHQAKIARYLELTPELGGILREFAGDSLLRNVSALREQLPVWHHAFGERLIGGENYISPPTLARGLFMAWADGGGASPDQLMTRLDQPWCRADLYYIEKLTAILRQTTH